MNMFWKQTQQFLRQNDQRRTFSKVLIPMLIIIMIQKDQKMKRYLDQLLKIMLIGNIISNNQKLRVLQIKFKQLYSEAFPAGSGFTVNILIHWKKARYHFILGNV